jgi:hypothetical protein
MSDDMSDAMLVEELRHNHSLLHIDLSNGPNEDLKVSEPLSTMLSMPPKCFFSVAHHDAVAESCHRSTQRAAHTKLYYKLDRTSKTFSPSLENYIQRWSHYSNDFTSIIHLQHPLIRREISFIGNISPSLPTYTNNGR